VWQVRRLSWGVYRIAWIPFFDGVSLPPRQGESTWGGPPLVPAPPPSTPDPSAAPSPPLPSPFHQFLQSPLPPSTPAIGSFK
jgi:hypothetical protein